MQCAPMKQSILKIKNRTFAGNDFGNLTVCEDFDFSFSTLKSQISTSLF